MKKKALLSSILTIALCLSLIAGSTFALFTSKSEVNVAVTAGKVDVVATVDRGSIVHGSTLNSTLKETSVVFSENDNTIALDKIVPGDYVNFNLVITNNSDVTVHYRTVIWMVEDKGLWNGLEVTIDNVTYDGSTKYADWAILVPGSEEITVPVRIALPEGAGNIYQASSCTVGYRVEAIQGNAPVVNPYTYENGTYYVNSEEGMMLMPQIINSVSHGEGRSINFVLTADMDMTGYTWEPIHMWWVNVDGQNHTVSNLNCSSTDWGRSGFAGYIGGSVLKNITLNHVTAVGTQAGVVAGSLEGATLIDVVVMGNNSVTYDYNKNPEETWGGVGAIAGVASSVMLDASNVTIKEGATVAVNYSALATEAPYQNVYSYIQDIKDIVTNNGTITTSGTKSSAYRVSDYKTLSNIITNAPADDTCSTVIYLAEGTYSTNGVGLIDINGKNISVIGVGDVTIVKDHSNTHIFNIANSANVTFKNIDFDGNYKNREALFVRGNATVTLEDCTIKNTGNAEKGGLDICIDEVSDKKLNTTSTVNLINTQIEDVAMCAFPVVDTHSYSDIVGNSYIHFNYDENSFVASIEKQWCNAKPENIYINGDNSMGVETIHYVRVSTADELTEAIKNASADAAVTNIIFVNDIVGNAIAHQKADVNVVVDGNGYAYSGSIEIYGHARFDGAETLTFKNINFVTDSGIDFIHCNTTESDKRYAHNITVDGCTFTATGEGKYAAVGLRMRQCYNITVKNSTFTGMHSVIWATGGNGLMLDNITVIDSKNGISAGTSAEVTVKNSTITTVGDYGYGIRADASGAYSLTVESCNITADAPILLRKATGAYTATFNANTLNSNKDNTIVVTASDYEEGKTLSAATGVLKITIDGQVAACNAASLAAVVAEGVTDIYLLDGEYDIYGCGGKTLTISGSKNAVIKLYNDGEDGCDYAFGSAGTGVGTYTFNGITFDTTANTGNYKGFAYMKGIYNNCNFVGAFSLNNATDYRFNNCTFDFKNGYFWTWGAKSVTFNGCTFNGNSKTILAHGSASTVININNCTFAATEKGYTGAGDWTAAIEIDPTSTNTYTVNLTGTNTLSESYNGWTRVKDGSTGHTTTKPTEVNSAEDLAEALENEKNIELSDDLTISANDTSSNSGYGATGVTIDNGGVFDGNGMVLTVDDANGPWDCAINPKNGTIQNVTVDGAFRGIFMGSASGDVYIDNVYIDNVCYTFNSDGGNKSYGVYISNSTLNGWTSYSNVHKEVVFTDCNFGKGTGDYQYAFCRPYNASVFENCVFEEGFEFDTSKTTDLVFINCYYGDTLITAENASTLGNGETTFFYNGLNGITIR